MMMLDRKPEDMPKEQPKQVVRQPEENQAPARPSPITAGSASSALGQAPPVRTAGAAAGSPVKGSNAASSSSSSAQQPPAMAPEPLPVTQGSNAAYVPPTWKTKAPDLNQADDPRIVMEGQGISLGMCGYAGEDGPIGQQLFALAGLQPPSERSFDEFFRNWFETEFFPQFSKKISKELVERAKNKSFFSGLSSQVKKWAMANTDARLQGEVWCSYFKQNAPPQFAAWGCVRTASVNLGAQAAPCWIRFIGIPDSSEANWFLPPWSSVDNDIAAVLDELDGRGGLSALVSSAA